MGGDPPLRMDRIKHSIYQMVFLRKRHFPAHDEQNNKIVCHPTMFYLEYTFGLIKVERIHKKF